MIRFHLTYSTMYIIWIGVVCKNQVTFWLLHVKNVSTFSVLVGTRSVKHRMDNIRHDRPGMVSVFERRLKERKFQCSAWSIKSNVALCGMV